MRIMNILSTIFRKEWLKEKGTKSKNGTKKARGITQAIKVTLPESIRQ